MIITRQLLNGTSPATQNTIEVAAGGNPMIAGLGDCDALTIIADLRGVTGGTLDVYLQTSHDDGTTWWDFAHFTQQSAALARNYSAYHVSRASERTTITPIGTGLVPALAAGVILAGGWGNKMRLLFSTGASVSAGGAQAVHVMGVKR